MTLNDPSNELIESYKRTPIELHYPLPSLKERALIKAGETVVELKAEPRLEVDSTYFKMGLDGTHAKTLTRAIILERLRHGLTLLPKEYSIVVFDAFRTIRCQRALLVWMASDAKRRNPKLTLEECKTIAYQFVADPDDKERPTVPTHNSGGAIDLGLKKNGKLLDFGTEFDEPSPKSETLFGELSQDSGLSREALENRRILFHLMKDLGFTNLPSEWWHYDLGDYLWYKSHKSAEIPPDFRWIFESMEEEALLKLR